nr:hypothetical protein [Tanacetum cinerariifolium]
WVKEVLAWKVSLDKLPTRLNLSLCGIEIPSISCPICCIAGESCSHLLFSCIMARLLISKVARWWELDIPDLLSYEDWLDWFNSLRLPKGVKDILEGRNGCLDTNRLREMSDELSKGVLNDNAGTDGTCDSEPIEVNTSQKTYANMVKYDELPKNLNYITTLITDSGNEVVIFDEALVRYNIRRMWGKLGIYEIDIHKSGQYVFKFGDCDGLNAILEKRHWIVKNKPLLDTKWNVKMGMEKLKPKCLLVWVKMVNVPLEAWTVEGISAIASSLGKPMLMDTNTTTMCHQGIGNFEFARVLVEMVAEKDFKKEIMIQYMDKNNNVKGNKSVKVIYDWKHPVCAHCKVFGHETKQCSKGGASNKVKDDPKPVVFKVGKEDQNNEKHEENGRKRKRQVNASGQIKEDVGSKAHNNNCNVKGKGVKEIRSFTNKFSILNSLPEDNDQEIRIPKGRMIVDKKNGKVIDKKKIMKNYRWRRWKTFVLLLKELKISWKQIRVLPNEDFIKSYPQAHAKFLSYIISDHSPAIICVPFIVKKKVRSFRFSNYITVKQEFIPIVKEKWEQNVHGVGYFKGGRGLRQGDPISPYLFTLIMEVFSLIMKREIDKEPMFQYHFGCKSLKVSHVCFVDDLVVMCHGDTTSVGVIKRALDEFSACYGLQPNHSKIRYLGVPLIAKRLGMLQLIAAVLKSIHVYWASVFLLPASVIKDINRLLKYFLWSKSESVKGKAKVAWSSICKPKDQGGFGLRNLKVWNHALLAKHVWNIAIKKDSLWCITYRDLYDGRLASSLTVNEMITNGEWMWPLEWHQKFPLITSLTVPSINADVEDKIVWQTNGGVTTNFIVSIANQDLNIQSPVVPWRNLVWLYNEKYLVSWSSPGVTVPILATLFP